MKNQSSKSALFLMELILAILFFALASAVCARLFVGAHLVSRATREANHAASLTQSAAACVQATGGDFSAAAELLSGSAEGGRILVLYDKEFEPLPKGADDAQYALTVTPAEDGRETAEVSVTARAENNLLFSVPIAWHTPLTE